MALPRKVNGKEVRDVRPSDRINHGINKTIKKDKWNIENTILGGRLGWGLGLRVGIRSQAQIGFRLDNKLSSVWPKLEKV